MDTDHFIGAPKLYLPVFCCGIYVFMDMSHSGHTSGNELTSWLGRPLVFGPLSSYGVPYLHL